MAALTAPRDTKPRMGETFDDPVKGNIVIHKGAALLRDASGYLINAASGATGVSRGVAQKSVVTTGLADGAKRCPTRSGFFEFNISASFPVTIANLEQVVYWEDNQTIAVSSGGVRPPAGRLKDIQGTKAIVSVGALFSTDGDLIAANNLSDVASPATARANIGANKGTIQMVVDTLVGTGVTRIPLPDVALTVTKIRSVLQGALTVGDAILTFAISGVNITGGAVTITQAGSAAGDQDEVSPSAANTSDGADKVLTATLSGTNTAAVKALITIEYTY